jgi:hypothetical protein
MIFQAPSIIQATPGADFGKGTLTPASFRHRVQTYCL